MDSLTDDERDKVVTALEQQVDDLERQLETTGDEVDATHARWIDAKHRHHAVDNALTLTRTALRKITHTEETPS